MIGLDFETTGVDVETACPVTATMMFIRPGRESKAYNWLIDPGQDIPEAATAVHGVTTEHARANGCEPARVTAEIAELLTKHWVPGGPPLVIYNAPYDLSLMHRATRRYLGQELTIAGRRIYDPLVTDRTLNRYRKGGHKLATSCAHYGVELKRAHTSDADVLATLRLAYMQARRHPREIGFADLDALQDTQRRWHGAWAHNFADYLYGQARKLERDWLDGGAPAVAGQLQALGVTEEPTAELVAARARQTRDTAAAIEAGAEHWPLIPAAETAAA
jgi:DNA polymerase-3 subunit epsilon